MRLNLQLNHDDTTSILNWLRGNTCHQGIVRRIGDLLARRGIPQHVRKPLEDLGFSDLALRLGPQWAPQLLRIRPYQANRGALGRAGWLHHAAVDEYSFTSDTSVQISGLNLQSGDILLVDQALQDEGSLLASLEPRSYFMHSSLFVILDHGGRRIPAVLEIHQAGARIVPLGRFVAPDFIFYGEVLRIPAKYRPTDWSKRLSDAVSGLIDEGIGYDFLAQRCRATESCRRNRNLQLAQVSLNSHSFAQTLIPPSFVRLAEQPLALAQ